MDYQLPSINLLPDYAGRDKFAMAEIDAIKTRILESFATFDIPVSDVVVTSGPSYTLYELFPSPEVNIKAVSKIKNDLIAAFGLGDVRIICPVEERNSIGIEITNKHLKVVSSRSVIGSDEFIRQNRGLPLALGADVYGKSVILNLAEQQHMLLASSPWQGLHIAINNIILSLIYKKRPDELKLVIIDSTMIEFFAIKSLDKHFLTTMASDQEPFITDLEESIRTLQSLCKLMEQRLSLLAKSECRDITDYNAKCVGDKSEMMPYIVVVVSEIRNLLSAVGKIIEQPIARLTKQGHIVGIHVIATTEYFSPSWISGSFIDNFPCRMAFKMLQKSDSIYFLGVSDASALSGKGDTLIQYNNGEIKRIQGAYVDDSDLEQVCSFVSDQKNHTNILYLPEVSDNKLDMLTDICNRDPLFDEAARFLVKEGNPVRTSSLQRRFCIGYNRAGRLMDQLNAAKIIGAMEADGLHKLLVDNDNIELFLRK